MGFRESLGFACLWGGSGCNCRFVLSGGCLMGCVLCLGLLWTGWCCCDHLFCSGWVVCINRADLLVWGLYCRLECSCRSGSSLMVGHSDRSGSFLCYSDVFCIE